MLAGRYRLDEQLGGGGFGTIWRAWHLTLDAPVAVKLIAQELADDENAVERFLREARAAAALRSPHVVQILDYGVDGDLPFIVMELLEGENLAERLARVGALGPEATLRILTEVTRAVARAHEAGITHRDLKPENVFLVKDLGVEIAKVLDFGLAKLDPGFRMGSTHTRTGALLGTPYYMSPEQINGTKEVDQRADLWALAVMAFELLTGSRPFQSDGLGELVLRICVEAPPIPSQRAPVPVGFDAWFARAVAHQPEQRFQTAAELLATLTVALGATGASPEASMAPPAGAWDAQKSSPAPVVSGARERHEAAVTVSIEPDAVHQGDRGSSVPPTPRRSLARVAWVAVVALFVGGLLTVLFWPALPRPGTTRRSGTVAQPARSDAVSSQTPRARPSAKPTVAERSAPFPRRDASEQDAGAAPASSEGPLDAGLTPIAEDGSPEEDWDAGTDVNLDAAGASGR